jgi:hypothetical protein
VCFLELGLTSAELDFPCRKLLLEPPPCLGNERFGQRLGKLDCGAALRAHDLRVSHSLFPRVLDFVGIAVQGFA